MLQKIINKKYNDRLNMRISKWTFLNTKGLFILCVCVSGVILFLRSKQQKNYCFGHVCVCVCECGQSVLFYKKDQLLLFIIQKLKSDLKKIKQNKCFPIGVGGGGSVIYPLPTYTFSN